MARGDPMPPCSPPMAPLPLSTAIRIDRTVPARSDQENSGKKSRRFSRKIPTGAGPTACPMASSNDKRNKSHSLQTTIRPLSPARSSGELPTTTPLSHLFRRHIVVKHTCLKKSADGVAKVVCTSKDGKTEQTSTPSTGSRGSSFIYAKSRPAPRRPPANCRTRLRRFGLSNPAIRLLGLSPFPHPKKNSKSGIGAELRPETGRFPYFPGCFRLSANHFQSIDIFCPFTFPFDAPRPPAPALRRNM